MSAALLVELTLKVSVALLAACAATRVMARCSAASRHLVWTLAIVTTLLVPAMHVALPRWDVALLPAAVSLPRPALASTERREPTWPTTERMRNEPPPAVRHVAQPVTPSVSRALPLLTHLDWTVILSSVWLAGLAVGLLRFVAGLVWAARIRRRSSPIANPEWTTHLDAAAAALGVSMRVMLRRSADTSVPVACGIVAPTILLPTTADDWPADRCRVVLLHEMAHVARRDCLVQSMAQIARALHWFNPLAHLAVARLRAEQEQACDDLVLAAGTDAPVYANHLVEIARASCPQRSPAWAVLAMARPSQLEGRLMAILDEYRRRHPPARSIRAFVVAAAALLVLPIGMLELTAAAGSAGTPGGPVFVTAEFVGASPAAETDRAVFPGPTTVAVPQDDHDNAPAPPARDAIVRTATQFADVLLNWDLDFDWYGPIPEPFLDMFSVSGADPNPDPDPEPEPEPEADPAPDRDSQSHPKPQVSTSIGKFGLAGPANAATQSQSQGQDTAVADETRRRVADALMTALGDENAAVREQALQGLAGMRDPRAIPGLIKALRDGNADVRERALDALSQFSTTEAIDIILGALKDPDAEVRERAARYVSRLIGRGLLRDAKYVDILVALLGDAAPDVRVQAIMALGRLQRPEAVPALLPLLKDPNRDIREQAADALGDIADPRAIDALTAALKDPDAEVREQAARSLGRIARGQRPRLLPPPPVPSPSPRVYLDTDAIADAVARAQDAAQRQIEDVQRQREQLQRQQEHIQRHLDSLR